MKWFLILLLIPYSSICQTVHMKDEKIVYEGSLKTNLAPNQLREVIEKAMQSTGNNEVMWTNDSTKQEIIIGAEMKLRGNQSVINHLQYTISFKQKDDRYEYRIDSVVVRQKERGYQTTTISSEQLIKALDDTGTVATETEKQLNEIDMRFQQLLDALRNAFKD